MCYKVLSHWEATLSVKQILRVPGAIPSLGKNSPDFCPLPTAVLHGDTKKRRHVYIGFGNDLDYIEYYLPPVAVNGQCTVNDRALATFHLTAPNRMNRNIDTQ